MNNKEREEFDEFFDLVGTQNKKILVPLIRRFDPNALAKLITEVQPMNPQIGKDLAALSGTKKK